MLRLHVLGFGEGLIDGWTPSWQSSSGLKGHFPVLIRTGRRANRSVIDGGLPSAAAHERWEQRGIEPSGG